MAAKRLCLVLCIIIPVFSCQSKRIACEAKAKTETGWVCGVKGLTEERTEFVSFLNVPYAKQPVGELRFAELQSAEPWEGLYDATTEGPICPQDVTSYFQGFMRTYNMDEACIHVNVYTTPTDLAADEIKPLKPILVFVHGGGFVLGAGHSDVYGPEYLIDKGVIVITFNYRRRSFEDYIPSPDLQALQLQVVFGPLGKMKRIGIYGFLSLNSTRIPGNNGIRDAVTLLRWVQRNARYFGGDPDNVTVGGESAGSAIVHLLTLSKAAEGLFKRAILMSGTAVRGFYTASPNNAKSTADTFLSHLNITTKDPEEIHSQLTRIPSEEMLRASIKTQQEFGLVSLCPVVESPVPGFTTILEADPEDLMNNGNGKHIPIITGYTSAEAVFFTPDFNKMDVVTRVTDNPLLALSPDLINKVSHETALEHAKKADKRYFNGEPTVSKFIKCFSETSFMYPTIHLVEKRKEMGAPTFMYEFGYDADFDPIKVVRNITYGGSAHVEDLTFLFRTNYLEGIPGFSPPTQRDKLMRDRFIAYFTNFMFCSNPTCTRGNEESPWPVLKKEAPVTYQQIKEPDSPSLKQLDEEKLEMVQYFKDLYASVTKG